MPQNGDEPPKRKRRALTPEQVWIREFLEFYGTKNITRLCRDDLNGISLIRAVEALMSGDQVSSEKHDGPGTTCVFQHQSDDDFVEVTAWFVSTEMVLVIKGASVVKENDGETDAA